SPEGAATALIDSAKTEPGVHVEPARPETAGTAAIKADTAELPTIGSGAPAGAKATADEARAEVTTDTAIVTEERPAVRPAPGRTGGIVTGARPPGTGPAGTRPSAGTRPPAGPAEAVRPPRTPIVPGPGTAEAAPPPDADVAPDAPGRMTPAQRKTLQRRRLVMLLAFVLLAIVVLLVGQFLRNDTSRRVATSPVASAVPGVQPNGGIGAATAATTSEATSTTAAAGAGTPQGTKPATATRTTPADTATSPARVAVAAGAFTFAGGYGPVLGTAGTVRRLKVAVESALGQGNGGDFADEVDRILGDPRSWIASGQFRLQRVPQTAASEFTVYLASARTSEKMCQAGGLQTDGYTSCRLPGQVIINHDRWQDAVPDYDAPLASYRAYAINHEVGHQLGHGHEACPGEGKPAPVMMQQTYGLKGCVANAWPYIDGKRYSGAPID
ncbi:MAG TPA: DUF3152 domain-containing protein, partial [Actinoplanes sp.]|nr:DUF3152 domain-containing protein [Actinoplanes sp.]